MRVLVVNAGSSSVKLRLLGHDDELLGSEDLGPLGDDAAAEALEAALSRLGTADAIGHRVVHGGPHYHAPVRVDPAVQADLRALAELAPLHQLAALRAVDAVASAWPGRPAVACFDTAFHATLPPSAWTYALPAQWRDRWGLRRYGFHGLAHAHLARRAAELLDRPPASLRLVTCHLGAGASLAAVAGGRSVDTTMGFTPLDGLVMATRPGRVDPGLVAFLVAHGVDADELASGLETRSGLLGLAGTGDMRVLLSAAADGAEDASLALAVYHHRLRGAVAEMTAALGGIDALVLSGGVGERSPEVRARLLADLAFLGLALDPEANAAAREDTDVSASGASARTLVVTAREDLEIARGVRALLN